MAQPARSINNAVRAMFEADTATRALGIQLVETNAGRAVATMRVTEHMVNGHAIAHGGYIFLLADTAFAYACNGYGPVTVASAAQISFVSPARLGDELVAIAQERTRYGRNGIYDVTVRREGTDGRAVVAEFRGHSRTVQRDGTEA